ncbi:hypothetical protein KC368_g56 [Hortaea werneckii]|nr:hypothetical protein KC368_g56 [Hortaea werneckii]
MSVEGCSVAASNAGILNLGCLILKRVPEVRRDRGPCFVLSALHGRRAAVGFIVLGHKCVRVMGTRLASHSALSVVVASMELDEVVELPLKGGSRLDVLVLRVVVDKRIETNAGEILVQDMQVTACLPSMSDARSSRVD